MGTIDPLIAIADRLRELTRGRPEPPKKPRKPRKPSLRAKKPRPPVQRNA
jgi:hypothetical protein